jgi:hypothetical protein
MKPWMTFGLFLVLVMQGCTGTQPIPDEALFKTWQGKPKDELISAFGPPSDERPLEKGTTILMWKKAQRHPSGIGRMSMAKSYYSVCVMEFELDQAGVVQGAAQRGCQ